MTLPQVAAPCFESSSSEMALYASLTFGLWHNSVEARKQRIPAFIEHMRGREIPTRWLFSSFTVLPNNVTSGLYGA